MSIDYKLSQLKELEDEIVRDIESRKRAIIKKKQDLEEIEMFGQFDTEMVEDFFKKPYLILPRGNKQQEWMLVVPKFFNLNVGWLLQSTPSYNVFIVNKYAEYLGAVPKEFSKLFKFKPQLPLKVMNGMMLTGEDHQDAAWERYKKHLTRREGDDKIKIKKGKSFELIAALIDDGILPFMRKPVQKEHLQTWQWNTTDMPEEAAENVLKRIEMDFFNDAFNQFLKTGAVGIFWATGVGKTLIGLQALSAIKVDDRPNVVISGTSAALKKQWEDRLSSVTLPTPVIVVPFQSWHKIKDLDIGVLVIDECHHLPANSFSKIATMRAEYRMGLSATPYREDGRSDYIFALTGFPVGLDWRVLIELGLIQEPEITLYLCSTYTQKRSKLSELLLDVKKTLIYCFSIDTGKSLSKEFDIPFVYGDTPVKERLQIVKNSNHTIVSSAMGEGISVRDIERTITYNFLFGSRMEETQFFGRLLHGEEKGKHVIMMTDEEYERYGKRLYGIQEKGFKIQMVRVGGSPKRSSAPVPRPKRIVHPPRAQPVRARAGDVLSHPPEPGWTKIMPLLDDRDPFSREMMLKILESGYSKNQGGLAIGDIKAVLDHSNIKYGSYSRLKDAVRTYYNNKDRKIARRKDGSKMRYYAT